MPYKPLADSTLFRMTKAEIIHTEPKANARGYSGEAVCVEPDDFCSHGEPRKEEA